MDANHRADFSHEQFGGVQVFLEPIVHALCFFFGSGVHRGNM
jgi:hypothetical protein